MGDEVEDDAAMREKFVDGHLQEGCEKNKAAKLTFQKDQRTKLQVCKFTMSINKGEELQI